MPEILDQILAAAARSAGFLADQAIAVIRYPIDPGQRIFALYLATSLLFAGFVYLKRRRAGDREPLGSFLFPRSVWSDPSAWLDVRYFFFHQIFRLVIYGTFMLGLMTLLTGWVNAQAAGIGGAANQELPALSPGLTFALILVAAVASDFSAFLTHYLQHKVPLLWEFHKVHHSATVMHPLTNYREHPVDNILYAITFSVTIAAVSGATILLVGRVPDTATLASGGALMLAFNLLAYNLRHSHIWLQWPGIYSKLFGSPAHHQVHHSCHPDHIDKNFAFILPIWDVLFGTFELPETNRDVRFGLGNPEERDYRSCLTLYVLPFRKVLRRMRSGAGKPAASSR